ncbi:ribonuclease R [Oceanicella sp. SM1341]|uniref:ribonuclease R n=1 Tax=Oceanicella sp. SM1341 TaxID=1548889 RepID=UPI000E50520C|nr:ribonuclease R [Oceanicella sp. SM1341]
MAHFPSKDDILGWIRDNPGAVGKREIARAFNVKGADRIALKQLLREMQAEGAIRRDRKSFREKGALPPVSVLVLEAPDADGDLFARPQEWDGDEAPPRILFVPKKGDPGLGQGDRILARLTPVEHAGHAFEARLIRRIGSGPRRILGLFRKTDQGGRIVPVERKSDRDWLVPHGEHAGARDGELVEGEIVGNPRLGLPRAKVVARLGDPAAPRSVSLIAIHEHGLPVEFSEEAMAEALGAKPVTLGSREDLRHLPLLTIDPSDARDHDDAVAALPDDDPENEGGHVVWVAIADVAHYVRPGSALDREARRRGNSTYFPDRVVPMLPEELSGDLCSLHEGVDRPCIALRMVLTADGTKRSHRFTRGLMRSPASLSYEQAQAAHEGNPDEATAPLNDTAIAPLFAAYGALKAARERRQPLALDLPERRIVLSEEGEVTSVAFRDRFDAHKLIEEFMVLSNVCAAETLERRSRPLLYRAHEEPTVEKLDALREIAESCGLTLARGQVLKTATFNRLLDQAAGTDFAEMINLSVLRSQTQAYYTREAIGHFGLSLARYAHFTSPIRRYADLVVHRALISAHGWGNDGLTAEETDALEETAKHISMTERRSMEAERDTTDRYLAAFLADRVGNEFEGKVSGVTRFGLFVRLTETGADGLIPISSLGREYFHYDADAQTLTGERSRREIGLGMRATVRLAEAVPVTGGLLFELLEIEGKPAPRGAPVKGRGPTPRRKAVKARAKGSKLAKKAKRRF